MDNDDRNDFEKLFEIDTSKIPRPQISAKMIGSVIAVILVIALARMTPESRGSSATNAV